ncbi:MAG TPA: pyridoxal phosphate-dependent aminotransferase [Longimicrobium sp.]|nr:pyridoxal phosphate-dependent aminotransferase [Longimicrobium sp.]
MPHAASHVQDIIEALSINFNNRVYEKTSRGEDVIVLSLGEAFFDIPLFPIDDLPMPALYHYSHSRGIPELRAVLAGYYDGRYGVPVDPATEIMVTAGSKIALHMAFMAILAPGDEVLIQEPAWVSYPEQVRLCHGVPVRIPWDVEIADYRRFVTGRTRAIVVNNPNNPMGRLVSDEEWRELHRIAEEHDCFIISDEAYSDYLLDPRDFVSAAVHDPGKAHTVVCNTLSKNYGMSGWRIGYVITNPELLHQILKVNQHLITCPATVLEHYMVRHFDEVLAITGPQIRDVVLKRAEVARMLDGAGLGHLPGEGTFYLFVSIQESRLGSEEFCTRLLEERGVCAVPGIGYGHSCDGFIRLSVGSESLERIRRGVEEITGLIRETAAEPDTAAGEGSGAALRAIEPVLVA